MADLEASETPPGSRGVPVRYRSTGTQAYRQVVRHVVTMTWLDHLESGAVGVSKSNLSPRGGLRRYTIETVDGVPAIAIGETLRAKSLDDWMSHK